MGEFVTPPTVHAYDAAGRHSQTAISETVEPLLLIDSAILTPTDGIVLTTTSPFDVQGRAAALFGVGEVTVTVNSAVWQNHIFGGAIATGWSDSFNPATYNPPGDGRYRLLSVAREDHRPGGNLEQTILHPITVTVDSLPPSTPTFTTTVFTTAHRAQAWPVFLTGVVTDLVGLDRVETSRDGEGWTRAVHDGVTWRARWTHDEGDSDNVTYTVSVRAVDLVSRTAQATTTVTFDVIPPEFVTVVMEVQDPLIPFLYHPVEPGQIITDSHILRMTWTPSSDGAGVRGYHAGWTTSPTATTGLSYVAHSGAPVYSITQVISEAQAVYARVVPVDNHGNRQEQATGLVYVDAPLTPDYVGQVTNLTYHGWMESGCTLMGVDRRVETHAFDGASLDEPQRFYATWNSDPVMGSGQAFRMAWEGANWDYEGDLFVYFDTAPGGATTLYDPYTATISSTIYLPGNFPTVDTSTWPEFEQIRHTQLISPLLGVAMQADTLLWVQSNVTATLMHWNGSAWVSPTLLTADHYRWDAGLTDLYLPFDRLDVTDPDTSSLNLLAVASEESSTGSHRPASAAALGRQGLRLWATMPDRNLVSSERVVNPTAGLATNSEHAFVPGQGDFALTHSYRWLTLGSGVCPNDPLMALAGETYPDSDLRVHLSADPVGTTYALIGDDLYHQWRAFYQDEGPEQRQFDFLDHNHPPLGPGSVVTYTLTVANHGSVTATGVQALVASFYALTLPGATQDADGYREFKVVDIGAVGPGATVTATVTGTVEVENNWRYDQCVLTYSATICQPLLDWATLEGMVFDERTPLTVTVGLPEKPAWEWLWADHRVDNDPPTYIGIEDPLAVVAPLTHTVRGYASDPSGVPTIELQVRDPVSVTTVIACSDPTPDDGRWACDWHVSGNDGDEFDLRANATDGYGHTSAWTSPWRTVVLDSTPPTVTLDSEARAAVDGQFIGPQGYLLTGVFTDSHSRGDVQVCRDTVNGVVCDPATVVLSTQSPTDTAHLYDDAPGAPIAVGADCLTRTFSVSESFFAADVDLGFTVEHPNREELTVDLFSPAGTSARLIAGVGNDANVYSHYDVWLDDAASGNLHNSADDDPTEPFFDRPARPDAALSVFNGEAVSGTWKLRICDLLPGVNDGAYQRAQLALAPQGSALSSAGMWALALPTPENTDGVTQTLTVFGLDAVGNRTTEPISLSYRLDTVAPALTVTTVISHLPLLDAPHVPVLTGYVSDGGELEALYLRVDPPDGASYRDAADLGAQGEVEYAVYLPLVLKGVEQALPWGVTQATQSSEAWRYTLRPDGAGDYTLWLEAYDRAGNVTALGPYLVNVSSPVYLPLVVK